MKKLAVILFVIFSIPSFAFASHVYLETSKDTVSVGDVFIVSAKIDAQKTNINSVEGNFKLESNDENLVVNDFSLSKSIFTLWPRTPSLSKDGNMISFVGGVPGGFSADNKIVFNIILEAQKEGIVTISPKDFAVFANDGSGTRVPVEVNDLSIKILPKNEGIAPSNDWLAVVSTDKTNPEDFNIIIGKEDSLFDGKKFAFFNAVDNQSGISYYEVKENDKPAIRSGSTYILENQNDDNINLIVTAYDKAGNKTISEYKNPGIKIFGLSIQFIIIILVILIGWFIFKKIRKSKINAISKKENI